MQFSIDTAGKERISVKFKRNWFTGRSSITINGNEKTLRSPYRLSTHFNFEFNKRWEFFIETPEPSKLVVEEDRVCCFGGLQPFEYNVYIDDLLVLEKCGY